VQEVPVLRVLLELKEQQVMQELVRLLAVLEAQVLQALLELKVLLEQQELVQLLAEQEAQKLQEHVVLPEQAL
jgi:hypothetical protein